MQGVVTQETLARSSSGNLQNGLFLQNTPAAADGDPTTSDGVFVFLGGFTTLLRADGGPAYDPQVGDELVLRATVTEFFDADPAHQRPARRRSAPPVSTRTPPSGHRGGSARGAGRCRALLGAPRG